MGQFLDGALEVIEASVIGDHQIGRGQPLPTARLGHHPPLGIGSVHTPGHGTFQTHGVGSVDHHPGPTLTGIYHRDLDHGHAVESLQLSLDSTEDQRMGHRFESSQLDRVVEHDGGERTPIDNPVGHDLRPTGRYCVDRLILKHGMAHGVGIDRSQTQTFEQPADFALSRPDSPADQPTTVPGTHNGRR